MLRDTIPIAILLSLLTAAACSAAVYQVDDLTTLRTLLGKKANPGDVIELQPGHYYLDVSHIPVLRSGEPGKPITLRGVVKNGKRPVIDASKVNVKRGIFWEVPETHDIVYEDLDLCHARGSSHADQPDYGTNAGAIYFLGKNITARRLHVYDNEDGWFATHTADNLLIEDCEIDHNGTLFQGEHDATHNFCFCARHQTVRNCYIHDSGEAQNFKSRGMSTVFEYNWVEEDAGYSVEVASDNEGNTLWLGNVIIKRTAPGGQRRILGVGDGTGVARGTLTLINNTIISTQPNDTYLFTQQSSTCNVVLINNVFAGPSTHFLDRHGKGTITGNHNWFQRGMNVPDTLTDSLFGDDPGFVNAKAHDFRPRPGSPLINAATLTARYLDDHQRLRNALPDWEPTRLPVHPVGREVGEGLDLGAFQHDARGVAETPGE